MGKYRGPGQVLPSCMPCSLFVPPCSRIKRTGGRTDQGLERRDRNETQQNRTEQRGPLPHVAGPPACPSRPRVQCPCRCSTVVAIRSPQLVKDSTTPSGLELGTAPASASVSVSGSGSAYAPAPAPAHLDYLHLRRLQSASASASAVPLSCPGGVLFAGPRCLPAMYLYLCPQSGGGMLDGLTA